MIQKLLNYINPLHQLGSMRYSTILPLVVVAGTAILLEFIAQTFLANPENLGFSAIYIFMALIMYFSFRDGIKGGVIATLVTVAYYTYIIYSRGYTGEQYSSGIRTTFMLATIYMLLAAIIGGLKQKIDLLIEKEADGKRRLHTILEQLPVGVLVSDRKGVITYVNARAQEILGIEIPLGFELGSQPLLHIVENNGSNKNYSSFPLFDMFKQKESVNNHKITIQKDETAQAHLNVSFNKIENEKGNMIAAAWIINDISSQIELEQRKDDFINMASHELKTPLTSLKLFNDYLLKIFAANENDPTGKILNRIRTQIDKLQIIVNELLDVSKIKVGKLLLNKEEFDLNELIQEVVEMYQNPSLPNRVKFTRYTNPVVHADRFRIYQVISNLISNALKYSPDNQPIIISLDETDSHIQVSVQDFGIGIPSDQHELIFDRLYQVAAHKRQGIQGFGMGLFICKEIMQRHGGSLTVESVKNQGSTFTFSLPKRTDA
jgi:PAS domain S-box-containing protein